MGYTPNHVRTSHINPFLYGIALYLIRSHPVEEGTDMGSPNVIRRVPHIGKNPIWKERPLLDEI